jgi:hypothetical protein
VGGVKAVRALLLPCFLFACTSDDSSDTGNDTGNNDGSDAPTSAPADSSSGGGDDSAALECAADIPEDAQDGTMTGIMGTWGSPCDADADCVTVLGAGAVCLKAAVVFELPLGYCSKPCDLPEGSSTPLIDDPMCDPAGGVDCLGVDGTFEFCAVPCTDNAQCERTGFYCRRMPYIAMESDPSYCLMPDCCEPDCSE